jgi:hypothetical protein
MGVIKLINTKNNNRVDTLLAFVDLASKVGNIFTKVGHYKVHHSSRPLQLLDHCENVNLNNQTSLFCRALTVQEKTFNGLIIFSRIPIEY